MDAGAQQLAVMVAREVISLLKVQGLVLSEPQAAAAAAGAGPPAEGSGGAAAGLGPGGSWPFRPLVPRVIERAVFANSHLRRNAFSFSLRGGRLDGGAATAAADGAAGVRADSGAHAGSSPRLSVDGRDQPAGAGGLLIARTSRTARTVAGGGGRASVLAPPPGRGAAGAAGGGQHSGGLQHPPQRGKPAAARRGAAGSRDDEDGDSRAPGSDQW